MRATDNEVAGRVNEKFEVAFEEFGIACIAFCYAR